MPRTKRSREASGDSSGSEKASKRLDKRPDDQHSSTDGDGAPLEGFLRLPPELKTRVFELCIASSEKGTSRSFDTSAAIGLLTASRELYDQVSRILYPRLFADVYLDRPSGLALFHEALLARPWLQSLVKSVTIGRKDYGSGMWPHSMEERPKSDKDEGPKTEDEQMVGEEDLGVYRLFNGLTKHEKHLMPKWCEPEQSYTHADGKDDCQTRFVLDAIDSAQRGLMAYLDAPPTEEYTGAVDDFAIQIFNVQAALDLYLMEMRRVEEEEGHDLEKAKDCSDLDHGPYPRLKVIEAGKAKYEDESASSASDSDSHEDDKAGEKRKSGRSPFIVMTDQLRPHLARRGGVTDDFNCLLALARSEKNQWYLDWKARLDPSNAEPITGVDMNDPQAKAMEVDTFNGAVAMMRSVFDLTKPSFIEFKEEEMDEKVLGGWDKRLVKVDTKKPMSQVYRHPTEDEGANGGEDGEAAAEQDKGEEEGKKE